MKCLNNLILLIIEDLLVVYIIKMSNIAFIFICDTIVNKGALFSNILRNWRWNILDIMFWRVVMSCSAMEQLCTSLRRRKNWIHVLLVRLIYQFGEKTHATLQFLLLLHSVQNTFRRIVVYVM